MPLYTPAIQVLFSHPCCKNCWAQFSYHFSLYVVRVRFVDYGNTAVEEWRNVVDLPDVATDSAKYPFFARLLRLDAMPTAIGTRELKTKTKLMQLEPLFDSPLKVTAISPDQDACEKFVLKHPNGKFVHDLITTKLAESGEQTSKGNQPP